MFFTFLRFDWTDFTYSPSVTELAETSHAYTYEGSLLPVLNEGQDYLAYLEK